MDNLLEEIKSIFKEKEGNSEKVLFSDSRYNAFPFEKKNFRHIPDEKSSRKNCFIDGSNVELIGSGNFSISLIRVVAVFFEGKKLTKALKEEFYAVSSVNVDDGKIFYKTKIIGSDIISDFSLYSFDETMKEGIFRFKISKCSEAARKYAELALGARVAGLLKESDIIVFDGTLQTSISGEREYRQKLYENAEKRKIILVAVAKSNTLVTSSGRSVNYVLNRMTEMKKWFYYPICEISNSDHQADIYFAKLHELSDYIFRIEVYNKMRYDATSIISELSSMSNDFAFPGYPYGLVEAHKSCVITLKEKSYYATKISFLLGDEYEKIKEEIKSSDSHHILDTL